MILLINKIDEESISVDIPGGIKISVSLEKNITNVLDDANHIKQVINKKEKNAKKRKKTGRI